MLEGNTKFFSALKVSLAALTLLAPVGYIIGLTYYQGFFKAYGVGSDLFPMSIQETYIAAYYAVTLHFSELIRPLLEILNSSIVFKWLSLIVPAVVILLYAVFRVKRNGISREKKSKAKLGFIKLITYLKNEENSFLAAIDVTLNITLWVANIIFMACLLYVLWVSPILIGVTKGEESAIKIIEPYLEKGCLRTSKDGWSNCRVLTSRSGKILYEGLLVATSTDYIAFFTKEGSVITRIPEGAVLTHQRVPTPQILK